MMILDGKNMLTRAAAHDEIARVLELPEHYGRNLDALWDVLGEQKREITIVNVFDMLAGLGDYGRRLLKVFQDAENVALRMDD